MPAIPNQISPWFRLIVASKDLQPEGIHSIPDHVQHLRTGTPGPNHGYSFGMSILHDHVFLCIL